jgi:hypothetical protein
MNVTHMNMVYKGSFFNENSAHPKGSQNRLNDYTKTVFKTELERISGKYGDCMSCRDLRESLKIGEAAAYRLMAELGCRQIGQKKILPVSVFVMWLVMGKLPQDI